MKYVLYKATSPSGKCYIGITNNFRRRMKEHKNSVYSFGAALRKYGAESFTYEFEYFDSYADAALREAELVTLDVLSSGTLYNECVGGTLSNVLLGQNPMHNPEVVKSHPTLFTSYNNPMNNPSIRENASFYQSANKKRVSIDGVQYDGVREAARSVGISRQSLVYRLKSKYFPTYFYVKL